MRQIRFALGLALALALLVGLRLPLLRCEPFVPGTPLLFDEKDYIRGAKAMPVGDTSVDTNEAWIRAPGTAWLLMTTAQVRGVPVELASCDYQRVQIGMWVAIALLMGAAAAMLFGLRAAVITVLLVGILPIGAAVTLMLHADTPFMLAQTATIVALLVYARRGGWLWLVLAGICAGLATLVRSPMLPLLPVLALWAGWETWRRARAARGETPPVRATSAQVGFAQLTGTRAWSNGELVRHLAPLVLPGLLMLACFAAVIAPWTIRNYHLYGGFIPSDTTGAVNLLDNNAPTGYPAFRSIRAASENPVERQRFATRQAVEFILADPLKFAGKAVYSAWVGWGPETFRRTWNFWTALTERTLPSVLLAQATVLLWPITIALTLLGIAFAPRETPGARGFWLLTLATVAYYTLTIGITHFEERYRLPFLILWLPYAGWCLAHPRALFAKLRRPTGIVASVALIVLGASYVTQVWPLEWDSARALALHARGLIRERQGDLNAALADQQAASAILPDLRETGVAAGRLQLATGDATGAETTLRAALAGAVEAKLRPPADAIVTLQEVLRSQGRMDESASLDSQLAIPARRRAEDMAWMRGASPSSILHLGNDDFGLVRGFYSVDAAREFRWSGPEAWLLLAGAGDLACLRMNAARPADVVAPTVHFAVRIDGGNTTDAGTFHMPRSGWATFCAPVPTHDASALIEVQLHTDRFNPLEHGEADARDLGVVVQTAELRTGPLPIDPTTGLLLNATATDVATSGDLTLLGRSDTSPATPGTTVQLTLWWRAGVAPPEGTFTFVHLLDAGGTKLAEFNAPLAGGTRPKPWIEAEPLPETVALALPANLAPGSYQLIGGAFDLASGAQIVRADLGHLEVKAH